MPDLSAILVAVVAFSIAFGIVKFVTSRARRRRREQELQAQKSAQTRQVRRARERKGR